jgi:hypothetical protein
MRATIDESAQCASAVLHQYGKPAHAVRNKGVTADEKASQADKDPEPPEDLPLLAREHVWTRVVHSGQGRSHHLLNTTFAGLPNTVVSASTLCITTLPAPITARSPIVTPGRIVLWG